MKTLIFSIVCLFFFTASLPKYLTDNASFESKKKALQIEIDSLKRVNDSLRTRNLGVLKDVKANYSNIQN